MSAQGQNQSPPAKTQPLADAIPGLFFAYGLLLVGCLIFVYVLPSASDAAKPWVAGLTFAAVLLVYALINLALGTVRAFAQYLTAAAIVFLAIAGLAHLPLLVFLPQVLLILFSLSALILMAFAIYFDKSKPRIFGNLVMMIGLSSLVVILASAAIYIEAGLKNTGNSVEAGEAIYFSTVAFSTLGFGDITPAESFSRAMAALEAVIGNIHLALFTGAAFFIISTGPADPEAAEDAEASPAPEGRDTPEQPKADALQDT